VSLLRLRSYQREAVASVLRDFEEGRRRLLVALPTGTGKSVVISALVAEHFALDDRPVLVLVHRLELVEQLSATIARLVPVRVSIEQADRSADEEAEVVVASVQTMQRRLLRRDWGLIIVDECHRALAEGYEEVCRALGCFQSGGPRLVGFTATGFRTDERAMADLFEKLSYGRSLLWAMREGYLVPLRHQRRFASDERHAARIIAELSAEMGGGVMVMSHSVQQGRRLARELQRLGVKAAMVDSLMDFDRRTRHVERFRRRKLDVLVSYGILVEGFDAPHARVLVMARSTQSPVVYMQALGRVLRPAEELASRLGSLPDAQARRQAIAESSKPWGLVVDLDVGNTRSELTLPVMVGLHPEYRFTEDVLGEILRIVGTASAYEAFPLGQVRSLEELDLVQRLVDVLVAARQVHPTTRMVWRRAPRGWILPYRVRMRDPLGHGSVYVPEVLLVLEDGERYAVWRHRPESWATTWWDGHGWALRRLRPDEQPDPQRKRKGGKPAYVMTAKSWRQRIGIFRSEMEALAAGERAARQAAAYPALLERGSSWRLEAPRFRTDERLADYRAAGWPIPEAHTNGETEDWLNLVEYATAILRSYRTRQTAAARAA